jgi:hypothetical protein
MITQLDLIFAVICLVLPLVRISIALMDIRDILRERYAHDQNEVTK